MVRHGMLSLDASYAFLWMMFHHNWVGLRGWDDRTVCVCVLGVWVCSDRLVSQLMYPQLHPSLGPFCGLRLEKEPKPSQKALISVKLGLLSEEQNHIPLVFILMMYELVVAMNHGTVCVGACVCVCVYTCI